MTEAEARAILLNYMQGMTDAEYPFAWVGDLIEEDTHKFILEATIHAEGENPREDLYQWFVNKDTSGGIERCGPVLR